MARVPFRAHGPTDPRRRASALAVAVALAPACIACVSYEPAPLDVSRILADLEGRGAPSPAEARADGAGPAELAAFAVTHNPSLRVARAQLGVAQALVVEAGLLSDPEIGWDGMDVLASQIVDGTSSSIDVLSGFGLSIPLPRPGELDARKGAARWRAEEARRRVALAEWMLAREVLVACEDAIEAERLLEQNRDLVQLAETTREYFARARSAGAATAIQANLAAGDVLSIRAERLRLEARLRDSRHRLNGLLGLPPATLLPLAPPSADAPQVDAWGDPEALVELSLSRRPDLAVLRAAYQAAEEELRLEVARRLPRIAIGTGITLELGLFTRFNRPAVATAAARREALRGEVEAQVHAVRQEVFDAYESYAESRREAEFLESLLLPNAEESLRLADRALAAGEVTLLEILALQRALVDARTRTTQARAELRRSHRRLLTASGSIETPSATPPRPDDERETPERR